MGDDLTGIHRANLLPRGCLLKRRSAAGAIIPFMLTALTVTDLGHRYKINDIFEKDYKASASLHFFEIGTYLFTLHGFRLPTSRATKHKLVYAADQRSVLSDKLADLLPNLSSRLEDDNGKAFFYLGIVQSPYLSARVNANRTDFEFGDPDDAELELPLAELQLIPKVEIRNKVLPFVQEDLKDVIDTINSLKLDRIRRYVREEAPQYRILLKNADKFLDRLPPTPTRAEMESALHRELFVRETDLKKKAPGLSERRGKSRITRHTTRNSQNSSTNTTSSVSQRLPSTSNTGGSSSTSWIARSNSQKTRRTTRLRRSCTILYFRCNTRRKTSRLVSRTSG
jgi:hypothetical protein